MFKEGLDPKEIAKRLNLDRSRIWRFLPALYKGGNVSWAEGQEKRLSSFLGEEVRVKIKIKKNF